MTSFCHIFRNFRVLFSLSAVVFSVVLQSSCASFSLNDAIIPVDSEPRGLLVYADKDSLKPLGKTPVLISSQGRDREILFFGMPNGRRLPREHGCAVRWLPGVLGNVGLGYILGPWAAGLGGAWDFLKTGKGYDCENYPLQSFSQQELTGNAEICLRYMVVPPKHYDEAVSDEIAKRWMQQVNPRAENCMRFADFQETKDLFRYLNMDHQTGITMEKLGRSRALELGQSLRSSHAVFLTVSDEKKGFSVQPSVYDLVRQEEVKSQEAWQNQSTYVAIPETLKPVKAGKLLVKGVSFLPNALSFALAHDFRFNYELKPGIQLDSDPKKTKNLPGFLTNWSLTTVDHPRGYNRWDLALKVHPSISASYQERQYDITYNEQPGEVTSNNLQFLYLTAMMNAGVSVHTPAGALSLFAGGGMVYVYAQDQIVTTTQLAPAFRAGWRYTAFLSRDVFAYFDTAKSRIAVDSGLAPISHDLLAIREWTTLSVGLGYFFPSLRSHARTAIQ